MPRKFRSPKARTRALTLADIDIRDQLCLLSAWGPSRYAYDEGKSPWRTWKEFLECYEAVRDEMRAHWPEPLASGKGIFAERVREYARVHGNLDALEVTYEDIVYGDGTDEEPV